MEHLASLPALVALQLSHCERLAGHGIAALAACTRLSCLEVNGGRLVVAAVLGAASATPALETASLASAPRGSHQSQQTAQERSFLAPPAPWQAVPQLQWGGPPSKIHTLYIQHCDLADERLAVRVAALLQLRTLLVNNCPHISAGGAHVSALQSDCLRLYRHIAALRPDRRLAD